MTSSFHCPSSAAASTSWGAVGFQRCSTALLRVQSDTDDRFSSPTYDVIRGMDKEGPSQQRAEEEVAWEDEDDEDEGGTDRVTLPVDG